MNLSIRDRTLLIVLIPQAVLALILGGYFIQEQYGRAILELESRGNQQVHYLARTAEFPLLAGDRESLQRLAFNELATHEIGVVVIIFDADQNLVAAAGDEIERQVVLNCLADMTDCSSKRNGFLFSRLVTTSGVEVSKYPEIYIPGMESPMTGENVLGTVHLAFDHNSLDHLRDQLVANSLLILLVAMSVALLFVYLMSRGLSRPIEKLLSVVTKIRSGDLSARTSPGGSGELRDLEDGVNMMAEQVELASANLNQQIEEATTELSRTLEDLELRHKELIAARNQAEQANNAKDLFLAKMSHELRTPLSTVIGYSRLLQRAENPRHKEEYSQIMNKAVEILQTTVDDILDFVKLQRDVVHLDESEFDLIQCLENAVAMQVPAAHDKKLELVSHCMDCLPARVVGDSVRLAQIVTNLLNNAIKFTEDGQVSIIASAEAADHQGCLLIKLLIRDSGIGIASENQTHLFQPFVQADETTQRHFGGSGLGLSIVSRLVESMGGKIGLLSEPGKGTEVSVTIELPVCAGPGMEMANWGNAEQQIVIHDPIADVAGVLESLLGSCGCSLRCQVSKDLLFKELQAGVPDLLIYAVSVEEDISEQWQEVRRVYSGKLLLLVSNENLVADVIDQLSSNESIMLKPVRRAVFRGRVRSMMLGVTSTDDEINALGQRQLFKSTVLVVEDNLLNLRLIMTQLEEVGAQVTGVSSGAEAMKVLEMEIPDVVFVDVHMPGMDGVELARRIRALDSRVPVYALTANVIGTEERELQEAGVRQILYKPMDEKDIRQILTQNSIESLPASKPELPMPAAPSEEATQPTKIIVPAGIALREVVDEILSLQCAIEKELQGDFEKPLHEAIHKLQGVARLFTRGTLIEKVAQLARCARDNQREESLGLFSEIVAEIEALKAESTV